MTVTDWTGSPAPAAGFFYAPPRYCPTLGIVRASSATIGGHLSFTYTATR